MKKKITVIYHDGYDPRPQELRLSSCFTKAIMFGKISEFEDTLRPATVIIFIKPLFKQEIGERLVRLKTSFSGESF